MAEFCHGFPEWWIQEHLAHHMTLQGGSVALQVAQELLLSQVQVFTEHVNVQVIPSLKKMIVVYCVKRIYYPEN